MENGTYGRRPTRFLLYRVTIASPNWLGRRGPGLGCSQPRPLAEVGWIFIGHAPRVLAGLDRSTFGVNLVMARVRLRLEHKRRGGPERGGFWRNVLTYWFLEFAPRPGLVLCRNSARTRAWTRWRSFKNWHCSRYPASGWSLRCRRAISPLPGAVVTGCASRGRRPLWAGPRAPPRARRGPAGGRQVARGHRPRTGNYVQPFGDPNGTFLVGGQIAGRHACPTSTRRELRRARPTARAFCRGQDEVRQAHPGPGLNATRRVWTKRLSCRCCLFDATMRSNLSGRCAHRPVEIPRRQLLVTQLRDTGEGRPYWMALRKHYAEELSRLAASIPPPPTWLGPSRAEPLGPGGGKRLHRHFSDAGFDLESPRNKTAVASLRRTPDRQPARTHQKASISSSCGSTIPSRCCTAAACAVAR